MSSIYGVNQYAKYNVYLDGEPYIDGVMPQHIDSVVYDLESQGINIVDEFWDEDVSKVFLISTTTLDSDEEE